MKAFKFLVEQKIKQYIKEMNMGGRRESENVIDRRNEPLSPCNMQVVKILLKIIPILESIYKVSEFDLMDVVYRFEDNILGKSADIGLVTGDLYSICKFLVTHKVSYVNPKQYFGDIMGGLYKKFKVFDEDLDTNENPFAIEDKVRPWFVNFETYLFLVNKTRMSGKQPKAAMLKGRQASFNPIKKGTLRSIKR